MCEPTDQKEIGGQTIHVGDCHVWAGIYYLDSPTDYREYIANPMSRETGASPSGWKKLDVPVGQGADCLPDDRRRL